VVNRKGWNRVSEPRLQSKSYDIPKQLVWDAWLKVRSNGGAAGADGVTIEQFGVDVKNRLYKLWNRMSSGSYFPGPVRAVEIPKKGGTRILGIPNVVDRIAQPGSFTGASWVAPWLAEQAFRSWFPFCVQGRGPTVASVAPGSTRRACRLWSSGRRGWGQMGISRFLIVCQAVVRSGVQGQSAGRCSQVLRCP